MRRNATVRSFLGAGAEHIDRGIECSGVFAARSFHSGGVNVLSLDGRAEFVSDAIDLELWREKNARLPRESRTLGY